MSKRIDELEELLWAGKVEQLVDMVFQGDLDAMYVLGMAYYDGDEGVHCDTEQCIDLLQRAADGGHVEASHDLGCFRFYGYGFPAEFQDLRQAAVLLEFSSKAGHTPSMTFLGSMFENGEGVERSVERATQLYKAAAEAGDELGAQYLARLDS